jgi:mannose-6-phosphate isomerase-like protein (cupin superfamily)
MKATTLPELPDAKSPAGADIRFLMDGETGNMIHSTVPPHQVNRATVHATVSEFWYVLEWGSPQKLYHLRLCLL